MASLLYNALNILRFSGSDGYNKLTGNMKTASQCNPARQQKDTLINLAAGIGHALAPNLR
jgi:hypothetical protein